MVFLFEENDEAFFDYLVFYPEEGEEGYDPTKWGWKGIKKSAPPGAKETFKKFCEATQDPDYGSPLYYQEFD